MDIIISLVTRIIITIFLLTGVGYTSKMLLPVVHKVLAERVAKGFAPFPRITPGN